MNNNQLHDLRGEQEHQLLVTCDKSGNKVGLASREDCHKGEGITHLAFMAFVIDKNNNIILTKRSRKKSLWPGFWDASVVSHVLPNETVEEAAERRGKEELGIEVKFRKIGEFYYYAKQADSSENEYCHVLIGVANNKVTPNPVEIEEVKKIKIEKLKREIKKKGDIFTPWLILALEKISLRLL